MRRDGQHSAGRRCNLAPCEKAGQNSLYRLIDVTLTQSDFDFPAQRQENEERKKEREKVGAILERCHGSLSPMIIQAPHAIIEVTSAARERGRRLPTLVCCNMSELDGKKRTFRVLTSSEKKCPETLDQFCN